MCVLVVRGLLEIRIIVEQGLKQLVRTRVVLHRSANIRIHGLERIESVPFRVKIPVSVNKVSLCCVYVSMTVVLNTRIVACRCACL